MGKCPINGTTKRKICARTADMVGGKYLCIIMN